MRRGAIFLDKDGTIIDNIPYNVDPSRIQLLPGAGPALRRLHQSGWPLIVVTNQAGVARGLFAEDALREVEQCLRVLLAAEGVPLLAFRYCPHHPEGVVEAYRQNCPCRKPLPGMILQAARDLKISPVDSWMIGDSPGDIEAGRRAGCRTIQLGGSPNRGTFRDRPHITAQDWSLCVDWIVNA